MDSLDTCSGTLGQPDSWTLAQCRCIHIAAGVGLKYLRPVHLHSGFITQRDKSCAKMEPDHTEQFVGGLADQEWRL